MNIAVTGVTGLLGSNLFLEWVKQHLIDLSPLNVFVFGRSKQGRSLYFRMKDILLGPEGLAYLGVSAGMVPFLEEFLATQVHCIDCDLDAPGLGISSEGLKKLQGISFEYFFHIASMTDFRSSREVEKALHKTNCEGTMNILRLLEQLKVREFVYIGTCYSRGYKDGKLPPDFIDMSTEFRNPYEKTKLEAESLVRDFCRRHKQKKRIFRPSTICGRLIERPFGVVTKYDVFYSWVAWCLRMKLKVGGIKVSQMYEKPVALPFRITCREDSGLNIVPADYAAKVIYQVCFQDDPMDSYYLVNNAETPHYDYVRWMLELANITGTVFVQKVPKDPSDLETLYYKTVGRIFTPYVTSDPMFFDTENLNGVLTRAGLTCPVVDKSNFMKLMAYARRADFGLKDKFT